MVEGVGDSEAGFGQLGERLTIALSASLWPWSPLPSGVCVQPLPLKIFIATYIPYSVYIMYIKTEPGTSKSGVIL